MTTLLPTQKFTLSGAVIPKTRPRVTRRGTFLPKRYREWKEEAIAILLSQRISFETMDKVAIAIELYGSARGDLDNIAGAILDALVQADIIVDDRISIVKELSIRHCGGKTKEVHITLTHHT